MPKTPVVTVTTPYGVIKRATWRTYSHAVVITHPQYAPQALAWCGSPALAEAQLRHWSTPTRDSSSGRPRVFWKIPWSGESGAEMRILPVDGSGGYPVGPVIHTAPVVVEDDNPLNLPI